MVEGRVNKNCPLGLNKIRQPLGNLRFQLWLALNPHRDRLRCINWRLYVFFYIFLIEYIGLNRELKFFSSFLLFFYNLRGKMMLLIQYIKV